VSITQQQTKYTWRDVSTTQQ